MSVAQAKKLGLVALTTITVSALSSCTSTELASLEKEANPKASRNVEATELTAADLGVEEGVTAEVAASEQAEGNEASEAIVKATTPAAEDNAEKVTALALAPTNTKLASMFPMAPGDPPVSVNITTRSETAPPEIAQLIKKYSRIYGVPEKLVHHVAHRESTYNPAAYHNGNYGLMQIRYRTAKGLGYQGEPKGLLDAETNLKYAVKYLRNAWLVADKDEKAADWLYRTGYYYVAKRKGKLHQLKMVDREGLH